MPDNPSWSADVQPIMEANCGRCHGQTPNSGAPSGFRLDVYQDTLSADGRLVLGAGSMSEFVVKRITAENPHELGVDTMPPRFGLDGRQKDTIETWWDPILGGRPVYEAPPKAGPRANNGTPSVAILSDETVQGMRTIAYEIRDPDRDIVTGKAKAGADVQSAVDIGPVHSGRGQVVWDVGALSAPSTLFFELDDGIDVVTPEVVSQDTVETNIAPTVTVSGLGRDSVIADVDSPLTVVVNVANPEVADTLVLDAIIHQSGQAIATLADGQAIAVGDNNLPLDTNGIAEGSDYWLLINVSDGTWQRQQRVGPFTIGHQSTTETFTTIRDIFLSKCVDCHGGPERIPNMTHNLFEYADVAGILGAYTLRGQVYKRIAIERNMPPQSYLLFGGSLLTDDERTRISQWILAGAPQ